MKFGELLKKHRIKHGYSINEVAEELFVNPTDLIEIEEGNLDLVTMGMTSRIATLFRIDPMEVLKTEDIQAYGVGNLGSTRYRGRTT